jgi:hypothetical protein
VIDRHDDVAVPAVAVAVCLAASDRHRFSRAALAALPGAPLTVVPVSNNDRPSRRSPGSAGRCSTRPALAVLPVALVVAVRLVHGAQSRRRAEARRERVVREVSVLLPTLVGSRQSAGGLLVDFEAIETLRERHPAWRLLRAQNATLILSFLGSRFVEGNHGATEAARLVEALDEHLYLLNTNAEEHRFPRSPQEYLDAWSATEFGWLRRFYPASSDDVHYDATPAFEKAYAWVSGLRSRPFIGTESRLHTVVDLLRQIVHGTESDPESRLELLRRQRAELDSQIEDAERGKVAVLSATAVRDRYQQFAGTARELLSDFREVEENFRVLDRAARERIAAWEGSNG